MAIESDPSTPAALPGGHRLGHFELRGVQADPGAGDDSMLYRAWDHQLAGAVAIAEYVPRALSRRAISGALAPVSAEAALDYAQGLDRFVDEAIGLADLQHPNLVKVLQVLQLQGTAYRVMPWYRGTRLSVLRAAMPSPPDEPALRMLLDELLGALQALHGTGRVHGNVNPGRILLLQDDHALLLGPEGGVRAGNGFQAPEQLLSPGVAGGTVGPWTDAYAVAQVVRFCISGLLPGAPGKLPAEPLSDSVMRLFADRSDLRYSPGFLRVIDLAASPDVTRRPQSADEFLAWLDDPPPADGPPATAPAEPTEPSIAGEDISLAARLAIQNAIDSIPPRTERPMSVELPPAGPRHEPGLAPTLAAALPPTAAPTRASVPPRPPPPAPSMAAGSRDPLDEGPGLRAPLPAANVAPARARWVWPVLALVVLLGAGAWLLREPAQGWLSALRASPPGPTAKAPTPAAPTPEVVPVLVPEVVPASASASASAPADPAASAAATLATASTSAPAPTPAPPAASAPVIAPAPAPLPPPPRATPEPEPPAAPDRPRLANTPPDSAAPAPRAAARPAAPASQPAPRVLSPRQQCGERTQFALYRCMQRECDAARWKQHPQCVRLRETDEVD